MLPLTLLLLALASAALAAPAKPPIFGTWGESVRPFKPGTLGDKWNPPEPIQHRVPPDPFPATTGTGPGETETSALEPSAIEQQGKPNRKASGDVNNVQRVRESNSVALFNGVPVDPATGRALQQPEQPQLRKRGQLKKKLGLQFLDDPDVDEETVRKYLKSPEIGMGLAASKGSRKDAAEAEYRAETAQVVMEAAVPEAAAPAQKKPVRKQQQQQQQQESIPAPVQKRPWGGNSFMTYNGVEVPVEGGNAANKAFDMAMFSPPGSPSLKKRGDVRSKLGLGMFDVPGVSGRRKSPAAAAPSPEELEHEQSPQYEEELAEEPAEYHQEAKENEEEGEKRMVPGTFILPESGKSFVIYNGRAVEVDGALVGNRKIKKPRPAFHRNGGGGGDDDDEQKKLEKRSAGPGRKISGLNPFKDNPITSSARDATTGETNSNAVGTQHATQSPSTAQDEVVRVKKGDNYVLFNGRPVSRTGQNGPF